MNLRIAVLLCMKGDAPLDLALRAVRSTAASLTAEDVIFLRVDGGFLQDVRSFMEAAGPVPLVLRSDLRLRGLAYGLNALLDEVLSDSRWDLLARMDADDESLPRRMACQRRYLAAHKEIDILGTGCREVDEQGRHLQDKIMPETHREIVRALPRSNPLNHPTVVFRRRVFDLGLRYREDVCRTEDYHLWIDAALDGRIFANIPEPLLIFRRDQSFFDRRGGFRQACADVNVRLRAMVKLKLYNPINLVWVVTIFIVRLLPGNLQKFAYLYFR